MYRRAKFFLIIFAIIFINFLTLDFLLIDVEKTALIVAIGIDKTSLGYEVTAQIAVPEATNQSTKSNESVIYASGETLYDAVNDIGSRTGWYPKLSFCNLIILGNNVFEENVKGFKKFSLHFEENGECKLKYENPQGEKTLEFKMGENKFTKFPQLGYFDKVCKIKTTNGYMRAVAVSGGWLDKSRLMLRVQITDYYTGNMSMIFSFKGDYAVMSIEKTAENSFNEYPGVFVAKKA